MANSPPPTWRDAAKSFSLTIGSMCVLVGVALLFDWIGHAFFRGPGDWFAFIIDTDKHSIGGLHRCPADSSRAPRFSAANLNASWPVTCTSDGTWGDRIDYEIHSAEEQIVLRGRVQIPADASAGQFDGRISGVVIAPVWSRRGVFAEPELAVSGPRKISVYSQADRDRLENVTGTAFTVLGIVLTAVGAYLHLRPRKLARTAEHQT